MTAAVLNHLDLVITCDTAVAHLAGALGRPTWLLLAHRSDWRWMRDREDSPWYPGDVVEALAAVADRRSPLEPGWRPWASCGAR